MKYMRNSPTPDELAFGGKPPPPKSRGRKSPWNSLVQEMKKHPGEWAHIGDIHSSTVQHLRKRIEKGSLPANLVLELHEVVDNRGTLWLYLDPTIPYEEPTPDPQ